MSGLDDPEEEENDRTFNHHPLLGLLLHLQRNLLARVFLLSLRGNIGTRNEPVNPLHPSTHLEVLVISIVVNSFHLNNVDISLVSRELLLHWADTTKSVTGGSPRHVDWLTDGWMIGACWKSSA